MFKIISAIVLGTLLAVALVSSAFAAGVQRVYYTAVMEGNIVNCFAEPVLFSGTIQGWVNTEQTRGGYNLQGNERIVDYSAVGQNSGTAYKLAYQYHYITATKVDGVVTSSTYTDEGRYVFLGGGRRLTIHFHTTLQYSWDGNTGSVTLDQEHSRTSCR